ncbi:MAG: hypothetical protein QW328_08710 [Nitrososphaerota archaeon]
MTLAQIATLRKWGYQIKKVWGESKFLFRKNGGCAYVIEYDDGILVVSGKNRPKDDRVARGLKWDLSCICDKPVLTYEDWFR